MKRKMTRLALAGNCGALGASGSWIGELILTSALASSASIAESASMPNPLADCVSISRLVGNDLLKECVI
jgi:hypothetical protein